MSTLLHESALQEDVSAIEEKRLVLEQIVYIAKAIEHMQDSLESVLILGISSKEMPKEALNIYSTLNDNLRNLPVNKIKEYLQNLEIIIKNQLEKILHYSGMDFTSDEAIEILYLSSDSSEENPRELLEAFKRTAQTAVSLRVLLKKRGIVTPGSTLPVPQDVIIKQMEQLDVQEEKQRTKIKTRIMEMKDDIDKMINNRSYPDGMKELLIGVRCNLDNDLNNIESGRQLNCLSFVVDAEEITSYIESSTDEEKPTAQHAEDKKKMGFASAASRWLNSPLDVTWKDIKESE